jgi:Na+/melibiose symporter-like transporter
MTISSEFTMHAFEEKRESHRFAGDIWMVNLGYESSAEQIICLCILMIIYLFSFLLTRFSSGCNVYLIDHFVNISKPRGLQAVFILLVFQNTYGSFAVQPCHQHRKKRNIWRIYGPSP